MIIDDKDIPKDNDDYHFNEADLMGSDFPQDETTETKYAPNIEPTTGTSVTQRNAIIVIVGLLVLYLIYRVIMWISYPAVDIPKNDQPSPVKVLKIQPKPAPVQPTAPVATTTLPPPVVTPTVSPDIDKKLTSLLSDQDKLQSDIQSVLTTETSIQSTIQALTSKIDELTKIINQLNIKIDSQALLIKELEIKRVAPPKLRRIHHARRAAVVSEPTFYLQAVIPGRAWLIRRNGTDTITVREGTRVPGYGVVQLIDPNQGRVVMTSGRVITFGQWDS